MKHSWKLRWRILIPLAATFILLWAGMMYLLTSSKRMKLYQQLLTESTRLMWNVESEMNLYKQNVESGSKEDAVRRLQETLNQIAWLPHDGGVCIDFIGPSNEKVRTQMVWGYAYEQNYGKGIRWQLLMEDQLDDAGILDLSSWIASQNQISRAYTLLPPDHTDPAFFGVSDGSVVRVTGRQISDNSIEVANLELMHPDGSVERILQTKNDNKSMQTWEFAFMQIFSMINEESFEKQQKLRQEKLESYRLAQETMDQYWAQVNQQTEIPQAQGTVLMDTYGREEPAYVITFYEDYTSKAVGMLFPTYCETLVLLLFAMSFLSHMLTKSVTVPIEELCRDVQSGKCKENGPVKELNTLACRFNVQQEKIKQQLAREKAFTRAAAHELKTPLAILSAHVQALQEEICPEKRNHYVNILIEETDHICQLVNKLMVLSRLESNEKINWEATDLTQLVQETARFFILPMKQKKMQMQCHLQPCITLCDRSRMRSVVENLVSNALRYGLEGTTVQIDLTREGKHITLSVVNDALPVSEENLTHLFDPFYRVDKARSRNEGGSGLGLAIVKTAMEMQGGSCQAVSKQGKIQLLLRLPYRQTETTESI